MSGTTLSAGNPDAPNKLIVVEPPEDPAGVAARNGGSKGNFLNRQAFVTDQRLLAITSPFARSHVLVLIEGEEMELPHDDPQALAEFVETVWMLYGWEMVDAIAADLDLMVTLAERDHLSAPVEPMPRTDLGAAVRMLGLESPLTRLARERQEWREQFTRRRMGGTPVWVVRLWRDNFRKEVADLRGRVLQALKDVESAAVEVAAERLKLSRAMVVREVTELFAYDNPRSAEALLRMPATYPVYASNPETRVLREQLAALKPLAEATIAARSRWIDYWVGISNSIRVEDEEEERELHELVTRTAGEFGAAAVGFAARHPVLFRFSPEMVVKAATAGDAALGETLLDQVLRPTCRAAKSLEQRLARTRPARAVSQDQVAAGEWPERLVAKDLEDSVWLHPRLVEEGIRRTPHAPADRMAIAAGNVAVAAEQVAREDLMLGLVGNLTLVGFTIALTIVCPPAGIALDIGLSAVDIATSSKDYRDKSDEALCHLDPREALAERPSMLPVVLAVAGAAMVAI
jgi:hypothetical protein